MGTRLRKNPERTFNWFFEASCPLAKDRDPEVRFQFPDDASDEESNKTIPSFCFPYDTQRVKDGVAVQHFTFVLTDLEGHQRFGFCRLASSTHTCLCIVSYLPWFEVFYKLLNNLADNLTKGQMKELILLLSSLYQQPVPLPSGSVTLKMVPYFIAPDPRSLPSIPENRNLTELIVAVDVGNLLLLYASLLFERRILIFASKLSALTSCVHALSALLYPMCWQHIFIPVLPPHLLDYCGAPMPYLIGVHTSLLERVSSRGLEEVVTFNVDTNMLETPFDDLRNIPPEAMSVLKTCLKRQAVSPGCGVSRAFLRAQALLFGSYRDALQGHKNGELRFSKEQFLDKPPSMRHFLESAVHLQFFKQFIDDRLDLLNSGMEPDDLFEEQILIGEPTDKNKPYHQIVGNLKKGGGALILNMKSKANTKAKALTRSGLKNLLPHKTRQESNNLHRRGSVSNHLSQSDCLQNRMPIKQHFGMSRPPRPVYKSLGSQDNGDSAEDSWKGAVSSPVDESDPTDEDNSHFSDPEEMDLLGEIFETLSSRSMHDRGLLYGTRSLDLFGSDSYDFVRKHGSVNPSQESLSASVSSSDFMDSWNAEAADQAEDLDSLSLDMSVQEQEAAEFRAEERDKRQGDIGWTKEEDNTIQTVGEDNVITPEEVKNEGLQSVMNETLQDEKFMGEEQEQSQESLSASVGSSDFMDSWNAEAADQAEDLDSLSLDMSVQEQEAAEFRAEERKKRQGDIGWTKEEDSTVQTVGEDIPEEVKSEGLQSVTNETLQDEKFMEKEQEQSQESAEDTGEQIDEVNRQQDTDNKCVNEQEDQVAQTSTAAPNLGIQKAKAELDAKISPKSAIASFRPPVSSQAFGLKLRSRSTTDTNKPCNRSDARDCSGEEEGLPQVKVSELKKRFEAK
ncbi:DENN domain-containing protein 1B isoform 1-T1 [Synchiropus picturatus]